jgi:hypothetical protein
VIPPEVSHPGHFATAPHGTTLAAYSLAGFEMRFLYAYGSAQAGFSPTKLDTFSVHAYHDFILEFKYIFNFFHESAFCSFTLWTSPNF